MPSNPPQTEAAFAALYRRQSLVKKRQRDAEATRRIAIEADAERHLIGDKYHFDSGLFVARDLRGFVGKHVHTQVRW